jgi:RNA polymerase sigma factor (sigma-70 family)
MERQFRSDNGRMDPAPSVSASARADSGSVTDDREWIDRIRTGDTGALETLFRTHVRGLTAFAFRYVQSYDTAAHVVTEVFTRLWQGRHSWAFHGSVRGNLFASTHRVGLDELRRTRSEARWHAGLPPAGPDQAASASGQNDVHAVMHETIARLPALTRTVAFMRWADRLSRAEIAMVLGSNVRTVHTQVTPASRAMRKRLAPTTWVLEKRAALSTLRDAGDSVDPFPMIDPDRIEDYLSGESSEADVTQLFQDVVAAGGDPIALEAMESAWYGPGRIIADLVDPDTAWDGLAHKLSVPRHRTHQASKWRQAIPDAASALAMARAAADAGSRGVRAAADAGSRGVRAAANAGSRGARAAAAVTAGAVERGTAELKALPTEQLSARLKHQASIARASIVSGARRLMGVAVQAIRRANGLMASRLVQGVGIVVVGIALTAGVWTLLAHHVGAGRVSEGSAGQVVAPNPAIRSRSPVEGGSAANSPRVPGHNETKVHKRRHVTRTGSPTS